MKKQTIFIIPIVLLLMTSLFNSGSVIAVSTDAANTNYETGDMFFYKMSGDKNNTFSDEMYVMNASDPNQLMRANIRDEVEIETTVGNADIFIAKESANSIPFTSPEGDFDHLLLVDSYEEAIVPSYRQFNDSFYDEFGGWTYNVGPQEDLTGMRYDNDKDNVMPSVSNATYLLQFDDMVSDFSYFDWWWWYNMDLGNFSGEIPLDYREVTQGMMMYDINSITHTLNTQTVYSEFYSNTTMSLEGGMDFEGFWVNVNITYNLEIYKWSEYVFDQANGALLEANEGSEYYLYYNYTADSFEDPHDYMTQISLEGSKNFDVFKTHNVTIDGSNAFYGASRPVSSGSNRIEEGDFLFYSVESWSESSFNRYTTGSMGGSFNWEETENKNNFNEGYGNMTFDVYHHQPTFFEAVVYEMENIEGSGTEDFTRTENGVLLNDDTFNNNYEDARIDANHMLFETSADEEIVHFFEEFKWIDFWRMFEGELNMGIPNQLNKNGPVNDTAFHIDLNATEQLTINGFDMTWFNVQQYSQDYSLQTTGTTFLNIPDGPGVDADYVLDVFSTDAFYYDADTGALLVYETYFDMSLQLTIIDSFTDNNGVTTTENTDIDIYLSYDRSMFLEEHPNLYLSAQEDDTYDHGSVNDTSSTPANSSSEAAPGLNLPGFELVYSIFAVSFITLVIRRRKN